MNARGTSRAPSLKDILARRLQPARAPRICAPSSREDGIVQRCSGRLLSIGARAGSVASRGDAGSVSRLRQGIFVKMATKGRGQETRCTCPKSCLAAASYSVFIKFAAAAANEFTLPPLRPVSMEMSRKFYSFIGIKCGDMLEKPPCCMYRERERIGVFGHEMSRRCFPRVGKRTKPAPRAFLSFHPHPTRQAAASDRRVCG